MYIRPVDNRGWLVPKVGTKFREVYNMLRQGLNTKQMVEFLPGSTPGNVRQMVFRIRNPRVIPKARPKWIMISQTEPSTSVGDLPAASV